MNFTAGDAGCEGLADLVGDGSQTRSFCYVSDEVEGVLRLSKVRGAWPVNIGKSDGSLRFWNRQRVLAVTGSVQDVYEALPQDGPEATASDISKAKQLWGGAED